MATATKKSRASRQLAHALADVHSPAPMEFAVFEDNGGAYHWTILAGDGTTLGQSGDFASYGDAEQAAEQVRDGAASARFEPRGKVARPVDLAARRAGPGDDSDAERWLDEGGSSNS